MKIYTFHYVGSYEVDAESEEKATKLFDREMHKEKIHSLEVTHNLEVVEIEVEPLSARD